MHTKFEVCEMSTCHDTCNGSSVRDGHHISGKCEEENVDKMSGLVLGHD